MIPKRILSIGLVSLLLLSSASQVIAAAPDGLGPWADSVVTSSQGLTKDGSAVPAVRSNPSAALGVAEDNTTEGNFFSLGFGGTMTLGFDNGISSGVVFVEATNAGYPTESVAVEISADGITYVPAGTVTQDGSVNVPENVGCAKFVRITDTSNKDNFSEASADGYDVDGVQAQGDICTLVTPTPTPPGGSCGCGNTVINQTTKTSATTGIVSIANTGKNKSNNNTGGSVGTTTGDATNIIEVTVQGGSNTAIGGGVCCCNKTGNATISGNGANSVNTINVNTKNNKKPKKV